MIKQLQLLDDNMTLGDLWIDWIRRRITTLQIIRDVYNRTTNDQTKEHCLYVMDHFEVLK